MPAKRPIRRMRTVRSKEDADRILREDMERRVLEGIKQNEMDAEEKQRLENELRDKLEQKERKLRRKEAKAALIAAKDHNIQMLTARIDDMQKDFDSIRAELEAEISNMMQLKSTLENELSQTHVEATGQINVMQEEKQKLWTQIHTVEAEKDQVESDYREAARAAVEKQTTLERELSRARVEVDILKQRYSEKEIELEETNKKLQAVVDQHKDTTKILQDALGAREEDDKRNVTLMQLLNQKLEHTQAHSERRAKQAQDKAMELMQQINEHQSTINGLEEQLARETKRADDAMHDWKVDAGNADLKLDQAHLQQKLLRSDVELLTEKLQKAEAGIAGLQEDKAHTTEALTTELTTAVDDMQNKENERRKEVRDHFEVLSAQAAEIRTVKIQLEKATARSLDLEDTLKRKDKEHFERSTMLNSQIAQQRTQLSALQQKLTEEKESRVKEVSALQEMMGTTAEDLTRTEADREQQRISAAQQQLKLHSDVGTMRNTIFELQAGMVQKEQELAQLRLEKDREIQAQKRLVAAAEEKAAKAEHADTVVVRQEEKRLADKVQELRQQLEDQHRSSMDSEACLKAQVANLKHITEVQASEALRAKEEFGIKYDQLNMEKERLQSHLAANFIPHGHALDVI